jgi:pantoate--beta-alanine ligase
MKQDRECESQTVLLENVIVNRADLDALVKSLKSNGKRIGVVPTMGALHEGHLSLVRESLRRADETIVTIFVNPSQFGEGEDLQKYPQTLEADIELLSREGTVHVFAPTLAEVYPDSFSTTLVPPEVSKKLEGEFRPTHFAGVTTVVLKLLNMTRADVAFFGQKDFQQQVVIKQMVNDLNVPVEIHVCPIARDKDGLALSSRNAYLSSEEREIGLTLNQTLEHVKTQIEQGQRDGYELIGEMRQMLIDGGVTSVDYAMIACPESLDMMEQIEFPVVAMLAAYVGKTRLIDNCLIES